MGKNVFERFADDKSNATRGRGERGPARRKRKVEEEEEEERDRRRLFGERGFSGFSRREEIGEDKQPCDMGAAVKTGGKT